MTETHQTLTVADIDFGADNLIPAVSQDADTGEVLVIAFMSPVSLQKTLETGDAWFWSRSRRGALAQGRNFRQLSARTVDQR